VRVIIPNVKLPKRSQDLLHLLGKTDFGTKDHKGTVIRGCVHQCWSVGVFTL